MIKDIVCEALSKKCCVQLGYDGYMRVVEVHAVGRTHDGKAIMRVWQVRGGSQSGERHGWKLLHLADVRGATIVDEESKAPRPQYKKNDKAMSLIFCQV